MAVKGRHISDCQINKITFSHVRSANAPIFDSMCHFVLLKARNAIILLKYSPFFDVGIRRQLALVSYRGQMLDKNS